MSWTEEIKWNSDGLVPAIAQAHDSGRLLTLAWMNRDALIATVAENRAVYWSRSRQKLWRKGEQSGHIQQLKQIRLDCDADAILLAIEQIGGIACHTGRESCFYRAYVDGGWVDSDPIIKDPADIYGPSS
jgi:phosphoribosyl-AMP cyclohydrolase